MFKTKCPQILWVLVLFASTKKKGFCKGVIATQSEVLKQIVNWEKLPYI